MSRKPEAQRTYMTHPNVSGIFRYISLRLPQKIKEMQGNMPYMDGMGYTVVKVDG